MIAELPPPIRVCAARERAFVLRRHFLMDGEAGPDAQSVASGMVGLHAARLSSPWVALRARSATFEHHQLRRPLIEERSLVKLRCMRRTLHILPLELAPIAHTATLNQRVGACETALRRLAGSERALRTAAAHIRASLAGRTETYRALERQLGGNDARRIALTRLAIKWLWERGELIYLDLSPSMHHERRAFALTGDALPQLRLDSGDRALAQEQLAMAHVRAFGPVSLRDIAWWSGMGAAQVLRAIARRRSELVRVRVRGLGALDLLLHESDLEELRAAEPPARDHLSLLSYEDPALKGYFESRLRYVSAAHYERLFNTIGEARASIMRGGRIVGIWAWNRRRRRVEAETFERLPIRARAALDERLDDMEQFLRAEALSP